MSDHDDHGDVHVSSIPLFTGILVVLLILTFVTVQVAKHDFGMLNTPVALIIAFVKATLVILFFMHVKYSSAMVKLAAASGFVFLIFLFAFTFGDYLTRPVITAWTPNSGPPMESGMAPSFQDASKQADSPEHKPHPVID